MDVQVKNDLQKTANTIRHLTMDAVQRATSGHPGLPLGCAEIGAYLYGVALNHNPKNPNWINRDRFILSAGHGSMLLYSCLYLAGFGVTLDQIKNFRKLHSKTPGHPEYRDTPGVEATTGPLGQGIGNSVGLALAYKILAQKFNTPECKIFDNKIYSLVSDGCMMEGAGSEVSSLAGLWQLDNLILIYDNNNVSLDGPTSDSLSDDTKKRYLSYGWDVFEIDGHDLDQIDEIIQKLKKEQKKPAFIIAHTKIGKGSPHKEGSHKVHGAPLGDDEVKATKEALGLSQEEFFVPQSVYNFFDKIRKEQEEKEDLWKETFHKWSKMNPKLFDEFEKMQKKTLPEDLEKILSEIEISSPMASRSLSHLVIQKLSEELPFLYGGSADLSSSDMTWMDQFAAIKANDFSGRNIKYGVREFAMGTISNGMALSNMILPFCGTFLVFSDYMRAPIRLAALSSLQVIYQFTHDSIFVGEDGPTHQPVEQVAALRAMPNLHVIRPSDSYEVKMAWLSALEYQGPTAIILTRQKVEELECTHLPYKEGLGKGAYIVKDTNKEKTLDYTLMASGSELALALDVASHLEKVGKEVRVISFPSFELFEKQPQEYKQKLIGENSGKCVSIEAAIDFGWHKYIGKDGIAIAVDSFGLSAPANDLREHFGFITDAILHRIL